MTRNDTFYCQKITFQIICTVFFFYILFVRESERKIEREGGGGGCSLVLEGNDSPLQQN